MSLQSFSCRQILVPGTYARELASPARPSQLGLHAAAILDSCRFSRCSSTLETDDQSRLGGAVPASHWSARRASCHGVSSRRGALIVRSSGAGDGLPGLTSVSDEGESLNGRLLTSSDDHINPGSQEGPEGPAVAVDLVSPEVAREVGLRIKRLEVLVLLRRLYRDVLLSERVLRMPIPRVAAKSEGGTQELKTRRQRRQQRFRALLGRKGQQEQEEEEEVLVVESPLDVLDMAEDVRELAQALQRDMRNFHGDLGVVFPDDSGSEKMIWDTVVSLGSKLEDLAGRLVASLSAADRKRAEEERKQQEEREREEREKSRVLLSRFESTSAVLGRVRQRLTSAVVISPVDLDLSSINLNVVQKTAQNIVRTFRDTWRRLNGLPDETFSEYSRFGLPIPPSLQAEEEKKLELILEVESLDKKLDESSRSRESRLRQKNALARTKLAREIRNLDEEVNDLRKQLAVRTLQLEMLVMYLSLEGELLLLGAGSDTRTDEDETLLIAEFGLLDAELARLRTAVDRKEAILVQDEELEELAADIPDLKSRLGIMLEPSIPVQQRLRLFYDEGVLKVKEGSSFYSRGLRLLGGDLYYSVRLFWAAVNGTTLKSREVIALRRTAKDILALIPFTIILIAPLTPVGHVVVFSFLQRYFPGFFPSSFTTRRQEIMLRYEALKEQMEASASEKEKEEAKAMAAAAAAETFEAPVEDEDSGARGGGRERGMRRRILREGQPARLLLLQDRLPEVSRILAKLKEAEQNEGQRDSSGMRDTLLPRATSTRGLIERAEAVIKSSSTVSNSSATSTTTNSSETEGLTSSE